MYKAGTYKLMNTVRNRTPDRRERHNWRAEVEWKQGTVFYVHQWRNGEFSITSHSGQREMYAHDERFEDIYTQLEVVEETPSLLIRRLGCNGIGDAVLDRMYAKGLITTEFVQALIDEELAE